MGPVLLAERNRTSGHIRERDDLLCPPKIHTGHPHNDHGTSGSLDGARHDKSPRVWGYINHSWMSWSYGDPENNAVNRTRNNNFGNARERKRLFAPVKRILF